MAILSISREYRSGGREIGRAVARELQYEFVDKERILLDLKASGEKWRNLAEDLDEVQPTLWEKFDWEYRAFISLIECYIYDHALKDRVVIIGRGSNFLLADIPQALKVRLTAPLEVRVERVMRENEMDRRTALWLIEKTDRTRAGYIQSVYGITLGRPEILRPGFRHRQPILRRSHRDSGGSPEGQGPGSHPGGPAKIERPGPDRPGKIPTVYQPENFRSHPGNLS